MGSLGNMVRSFFSGGGGAQPRFEQRPQPVLSGMGQAIRSSSGAPVTSRFGAAAPVESRSLEDAVRVALMPRQPDVTGVPLDDGPFVKPWQGNPDISGAPLDDGVIVKPWRPGPDVHGVPLDQLAALLMR